MPYIKKIDRRQFDSDLETLNPTNAGELNYCITFLLQNYFFRHGSRYQQINDIVGALESAKLEFTRRITNAYEDTVKGRNGDVYPEEFS